MIFDINNTPSDIPRTVWSPDGKPITIRTQLEFNYLREEIVRHQESGWKLEWDGSYIGIGDDGYPNWWPEGLFDMNGELLSYIAYWGRFKETPTDIREELIDKDIEYENTDFGRHPRKNRVGKNRRTRKS